MNRSILAPVGLALLGTGSLFAYLWPSASHTTEYAAAAAPVLAALAVAVAIVMFRPVRPVPWLLYGVGIAILGLAVVVRADEWYGSTGVGFPAGFEAVTILAYPSLFVATIGITSGRRHARDLLAGSEPTLPVFMYSQMRFPQRLPGVLAMGAAILMISFIVITFAEWVRRRGSYGGAADTGL